MTSNTQALEDLLELLDIPGKPAEEAQVSAHLQNKLITMGVPQDNIVIDHAQNQSEYGGNTGNLIVLINGRGQGERWMFSTHMDTVPGAVGTLPKIEGDWIVSNAPDKALGGDNRAGCATLLQVARALCALEGNHPPATLVFFIQEEVGLVGARGLDLHALGTPRPTLCFNFDGGAPDQLVTKVIGTERFNIHIKGVAAHAGSRPEKGVSAAMIASLALAELHQTGWHGKIDKTEGQGSGNIGTLAGGTGSNVVMPELHILAEARSHSATFRKTIIQTYQNAFLKYANQLKSTEGLQGSVTFSPGPSYEPFDLGQDTPVIVAAQQAAKACGFETTCVTNNGGMDANQIVAHGIPAVTIGVGQENAHTPQERLNLPRFYQACQFAVAIATLRK
ncbi:MAG: M20/M25/M40 family metallo-hydrolase [Candidatus Latescibacterota bacterium]